ncbi:MAG: ribonuclease J [Bdellovibrionales bacterium]|nr:ribonuclease J [Bdellovibrionales bacterium]
MSKVRIIPLGGLGEVGMNCMVFETDTDAIILDCGAMASHHQWLGFDFIIPEFTYLKSIQKKIKALVITHGHEDHIGAIPYLLDEVEIPKIYCSTYAYEILKFKLNKLNKSKANFEFIDINTEYVEGDFSFSYYPITHSIVESHLVYLKTPAGNILHTGDFKVDPKPYINWEINWDLLKNKNVDLLLSDSTNSEKAGRSTSESSLYDSFKQKISSATGNVFVCCFSSHSPRMQLIFDVSKELNKSVVLVGASMLKFFDINRRLGYLRLEGVDLITDENKIDLSSNKNVFLCTGSQGEYSAAMSKILRDENSNVKLREQDTFILSALKIPGNEINVRYLINSVSAIGCKIYHHGSDNVHTSGHAYQDEQKQIFEFFNPTQFLPVHGDYEMLRTHAKTAKDTIKDINVIQMIDGQVTVFEDKKIRLIDEVISARKRWVRGREVGAMDDRSLKERKKMARDGAVFAFFFYENGKLYDLPQLHFLGFECDAEIEKQIVEDFAKDLRAKPMVLEDCEAVLGRIVKKYLGHKPAVRCKIGS